MVEHLPWIGEHYANGIKNQRVAIVGHSHPSEKGEQDLNDYTNQIVKQFIEGQNIKFFSIIQRYFGFENRSEFWNRVLFINYISDWVPSRYHPGTGEQIDRAKQRFQKLLSTERPDKIFVFTSKGWSILPPTREECDHSGLRPISVEISEFSPFRWGTYVAGDHTAMAFGLRHPQGANTKLMQRVVRHIMTMPLVGER
jgi:hypothetical protein